MSPLPGPENHSGKGPLARRLGPIGTLLAAAAEPVYRAALTWRNRAFDKGRGVRALPLPVISVGNLTVGGTGKSPMVAWLAGEVRRLGFRPAIATRGYGSARAGGLSDEAEEYRRLLPGVPVAVGADRFAAIQRTLMPAEGLAAGVDCILLDDGFQHRRLRRDLDIVLIDCTRDVLANRLLPAGWLREPFESLARARAVVFTHMEAADPRLVDRMIHRVRAVMGPIDPMRCRHEWVGLDGLGDPRGPEAESGETTRWLRSKRVLAVCAIGNPRPFLGALRREVDDEPVAEFVLPDHDAFSDATVRRIATAAAACSAQAIVCTNKDWSKLARVPRKTWPCPVVRPRLRLRFEAGEDRLLALIKPVLRAGLGHSHPDGSGGYDSTTMSTASPAVVRRDG